MEFKYNMNHKYRGQALIIGNDFADKEDMNRTGCEKDLEMMEALFTRLDFLVIRRQNLTAKEMIKDMREAARHPINKESDCFVLVISTHGTEIFHKEVTIGMSATYVWQNAVFGQDGVPLYVNDIVKIFLDKYAPGLEGKPRLFFIQACRSRNHPQSISKYDFGHILEGPEHWIHSEVDVNKDVDDLFEGVEGDIQAILQMEDCRGKEEEIPMLNTSFDIVPVNCPNDFLFMYSAMPGKVAIRDSLGSLLLQCMHKGKNLERLIMGDGLLQYLTYVSGDMAASEYIPDLVMESKTETDRKLQLKMYMENSVKILSEDKDMLIKELGAHHGEQLKTKTDVLIVEEYLKNHLDDFTVKEMQGLLKYLMPIKVCACIVHRLRDNIFFTAKTKKSPLAKLIDYLNKKLSNTVQKVQS